MATQTSSLIGANLGGTGDTTQLFALGTRANGDQGSVWEYVEVTSTLVTGKIVTVGPNGTAKVMVTAFLTAYPTGIDLGFAQNTVNQGEFTWVAKNGRQLYVLCSASMTAGSDFIAGFGANSGRFVPSSAATVGATCLGVYFNSSVLTSDLAEGVVTVATLVWPHCSRS